jgi:hypothetical protein
MTATIGNMVHPLQVHASCLQFFFNLYILKLISIVYLYINISNMIIICMNIYEVKEYRKLNITQIYSFARF